MKLIFNEEYQCHWRYFYLRFWFWCFPFQYNEHQWTADTMLKKLWWKFNSIIHPFYRFIMMKTKPLVPPGAIVGNQFWYPKIQWPSSWKWIWKWPAIIHHQKWPLLLNGPIWEQFLMEDLFSSCYTKFHNGYNPSKTILDFFGI